MPKQLIGLIESGAKTVNGTKLGLSAIHGHHIVMKGRWKSIPSVKKAQNILKTFDVDLIKTQEKMESLPADQLHNMAFAINNYKGTHSARYADAVLEKLQKAVDRGRSYEAKRQNVISALAEMRKTLEEGKTYW